MIRFALVTLLLLAAMPAQAGCRAGGGAASRHYFVWARACDRVTGRCVMAPRYFRHPVWR